MGLFEKGVVCLNSDFLSGGPTQEITNAAQLVSYSSVHETTYITSIVVNDVTIYSINFVIFSIKAVVISSIIYTIYFLALLGGPHERGDE